MNDKPLQTFSHSFAIENQKTPIELVIIEY